MLALLAVGPWPVVWGQQAPLASLVPANLPDEYTVKAVFLYSFGRYTEWPATAFSAAGEPFVIGVLGEDPFAGALDEIALKKTLQQRPMQVRRFSTLQEFRPPCHILFVSRSVSVEDRAAVVEMLAGRPVLVIGESPGFAGQGATANFVYAGNRIRFEINMENARRARLRMDAKLLSLGIPVNPDSPVETGEE
ncbi:MAG: YfiR family protein [Patescibacteria group bacterium]|nr:YfiR family protein [Patescibacteria group bacterium]